jgi:HEAT repeat protein
MLIKRIRPSNMLLWVLAWTVVAGCAQGSFPKISDMNPFQREPEYKSMYGPTPAQELEQLRSLAERGSTLGSAEASRMAHQLSERLKKDTDGLMREQIVLTLAEIPGDAAKEGIRHALTDEIAPVRRAAVEAWGRHGGEGALTALSEALARDPDIGVRLTAARSIGRMKHPDAARTLAGFLDDRQPGIQLAAIHALREMTGKEMPDDVSAWKSYVASTYGPAIHPGTSGDGTMLANPASIDETQLR